MSLKDIIAQDKAIGRLERARQMGRTPHGYIFCGPEGVGKVTLAREWAKLQFCSAPVAVETDRELTGCDTILDGCGNCKDCHLMASGTHPDLHFIDRDLGRFTKNSNRRTQLMSLPIDVIREYVVNVAGGFPMRGKSKVFIIDEADSMGKPAQNALLKTLEEPPEGTYLILCTSRPDLLLKTIHSRTQMVRFGPLPERFIMEKLREQMEISTEQAEFWASFSSGRLGSALLMAKLDIFDLMTGLIDELSKLSYKSVLTLAKRLADSGKEYSKLYTKQNRKHSASDATRMGYKLFMQLFSWAYQSAIYIQAGIKPAPAAVSGPIETLARTYSPQGCARAIQCSARTEGTLMTNANPPLLFETLLLDYIDLR